MGSFLQQNNRVNQGPRQVRPMRTVFGNGKKKFPGHEKVFETTAGWSLSAAMSRKHRNRRDLARLYGMEPVSDEIYDTIMRADNGRATDGERRILEQYIKEKTAEIRCRKMNMDLEGGGMNRAPGRIAENSLLDLAGLIRDNEESEDSDEY